MAALILRDIRKLHNTPLTKKIIGGKPWETVWFSRFFVLTIWEIIPIRTLWTGSSVVCPEDPVCSVGIHMGV